MKKRVIVLVLVGAAAAAAVFVIARRSGGPTKQSLSGAKSEIALDAAPRIDGMPDTVVRPSTGSGRTKTSSPAGPQLPKAASSSPIRILFEATTPLEKDKAVPVTLSVESVPEGWPAQIGEGAQLELLLRLPIGVKLQSENWTAVEMSAEEKKDPTGPWSLYEKKISLKITPGVPPESLLKETLQLAVVEEGTNWIITTRVRLVQGSDTWQAFGALFATLQGNSGQFHTVPKAPTDIRSAQAN